MPLLQTAQIYLSAWSEADVPALTDWHQQPEFLQQLDARPAMPRSERSIRQWLAETETAASSYLFVVRQRTSDEAVGFVELDGILWNHGVTGISLGIDPAQQNRGYGRQALECGLHFAFAELNLHRVQLTVFSSNTTAIALYERLGFQHEGTYREFLHRNGTRRDMLLYGLLRHEWATRQGSSTPG